MNSLAELKLQSALRVGDRQDAEAIKAIMAPVIHDTTASFASKERSVDDWANLIEARHLSGRAFYVAEFEGKVIGYATYDQFRPENDGYRHTMEHSVFLNEKAQGQGLGRILMLMIEEHAREAGHHSMIGVIDADNAPSISFHMALGYELAGRLPKVGIKFDRWLDALFLQKFL